jgi:hypothetical protein
MKRSTLFLFICGITLISWMGSRSYAEASPDITFNANTLFPLNPGEVYTYQQSKQKEGGTTTVQQRIGKLSTQEGAVIPIREIDEQGVTVKVVYFTADSTQGLLNHGEDDIKAGCAVWFSPPLTIPNGLAIGETVKQTTNVVVKGQSAACLPATTVAYTITFESVEAVTVPAGTFADCIKLLIRKIWQDVQGKTLRKESVNLFLAPNVGLVKEIAIEDQEIAELISFGNTTSQQQANANEGQDTVSHDLSIGIEMSQSISQDAAVQGYTLTIPYISHSFEADVSENIVLTIDSRADFTLEKVSEGEEVGNALNVESEPALEWSFLGNLSLKESFPFSFSNYKSGEHGAKRENTVDLASRTEFIYSTLEEDLHGRSPWDQFQKGFKLAGIYDQQLYSQDAGQQAEGLDNSVGVEAEYSYFREPSAWMVIPSVSLYKHLNVNVDESLEIDAAVTTMKDFNTSLTGGFTLGLNNVKPDAATKMTSELHVGVEAIVNTFRHLEITTAFDYNHDLSDSMSYPVYKISLGIEYDIFGAFSSGKVHESRRHPRGDKPD